MTPTCSFCSEASTSTCARCRRELCPFHRLGPTQRCPHCEQQWNRANQPRAVICAVAAAGAGAFGILGAYGLSKLAIVHALLGNGEALLFALPIAMAIGTHRWVNANVFRRRFLKESVHALPTAKIVGRLG